MTTADRQINALRHKMLSDSGQILTLASVFVQELTAQKHYTVHHLSSCQSISLTKSRKNSEMPPTISISKVPVSDNW